jgi:hypothetical protein
LYSSSSTEGQARPQTYEADFLVLDADIRRFFRADDPRIAKRPADHVIGSAEELMER